MNVLRQFPFVKLLIPFILGIVIAIVWPQVAGFAYISLLIFLGLGVYVGLKKNNLLSGSLSGVCISLVFLSWGAFLTYNADPHNQKQNLKKAGLHGIYLVRVDEAPQIKAKTIKIKARVIRKIIANEQTMIVNEQALFYFDKHLKIPHTGDELIVKCFFKAIPEPENPNQFNYKRFLKWQGIYYQAFVREKHNVVHTGINSASFIQTLAYKGSEYLKKLFKENIHDSIALGVTEALIFGYKEDLPKDLVESYSRTGTLHVLAVSGLHVAIVFLLLANSLWFLERWRHGIWIKMCIVTFCIWGYCILTGLSPSIIRAGVMISLVLFGKALNRNANVFNTVAVSAFIILCINPFWLMNVGFQLSFAAVLGIVYLQEFLLPLWTPPNFFFRQVWNILIISISAQIATFPLSLYYFNQFPNYFLLSNLIIIPLTTAVIYTGIGMILFSKLPLILLVFSWLTENFVKLTNYLVVSIENFPHSYIDGIKIDTYQLLFLYVSIMGFIFWFIFSDKKGLLYALLSLTFIMGIYSYDKIMLQKEKRIVIFNIPNQNAILFTDGKKSLLLSDSLGSGKTMFYIRGWLVNKRLWPITGEYDLKTLRNQMIKNEALGFASQKGIILFKGLKINLSSSLNLNTGVNYTYILPTLFDWKKNYSTNVADTIYIGQCKSKKLQKSVKNFLSIYHKCVIYNVNITGFKILKLSE